MIESSTSNDALYGLIGYPLGHSFSKDFFNQKFETEGIKARYLNFEIDDINKVVEIVDEYPNLCGLNVTAPYKQTIMPLLTSVDDVAQTIGAVNTVKIVRNGSKIELKGYNTDEVGFYESVQPFVDEVHKAAIVLGSGGASKAVCYALNRLGGECVHVSRQKSAKTATYEELTKAMVHKCKIIVNATPVGMYPHVDECPDFPYRFLTPEHVCYDLIYNPEETLFLKRAKQYGATAKNGLEMLLLQAFASYRIWTT